MGPFGVGAGGDDEALLANCSRHTKGVMTGDWARHAGAEQTLRASLIPRGLDWARWSDIDRIMLGLKLLWKG